MKELFPENTALETRQRGLCLTPKHTCTEKAGKIKQGIEGFPQLRHQFGAPLPRDQL